MKSSLATALAFPRKAADYKTKHLNVWVSAGSPYFDAMKWVELKDEINIEALSAEGWDCYIGLDLASQGGMHHAAKLPHLAQDGFLRDQLARQPVQVARH